MVQVSMAVLTAGILSVCTARSGDPATSTRSLDSLLERGDLAFRKFDNAAALEFYQAAYAADSNSFPVLVRLTRTRNDNGRLLLRVTRDSSEMWYEAALACAERLHALYPDSADSNLLLALCKGSLIPFYGIRDKIRCGKEVEDLASRAVAIDSSFAPAYVVLGIFWRQAANLSWLEKTFVRMFFGTDLNGTLEDAERSLKHALAIEPQNLFAHFELAIVYRDSEKIDKAREQLQMVLGRAPQSARESMQQGEAEKFLARLAGQNSGQKGD